MCHILTPWISTVAYKAQTVLDELFSGLLVTNSGCGTEQSVGEGQEVNTLSH